jgi:hypothetical protein
VAAFIAQTHRFALVFDQHGDDCAECSVMKALRSRRR